MKNLMTGKRVTGSRNIPPLVMPAGTLRPNIVIDPKPSKPARRAVVYLQLNERDALIEYFAVEAAAAADADHRARIERFADLVKAADLI